MNIDTLKNLEQKTIASISYLSESLSEIQQQILIENQKIDSRLDVNDNLKEFISDIAKFQNINVDELYSKSRYSDVPITRFIVFKMYFIFYKNYSLTKVGKIFNKHHATVIHGLTKIDNLCETEKLFAEKVSNIESFLKEKYKSNADNKYKTPFC